MKTIKTAVQPVSAGGEKHRYVSGIKNKGSLPGGYGRHRLCCRPYIDCEHRAENENMEEPGKCRILQAE